jgi:hypothetical protein
MKQLPKRNKTEASFRWVMFGQAGQVLFALIDPKNWMLKPNSYFVSESFIQANLTRLKNISRQVEGKTKVLLLQEGVA